jgi:DNA-binding transcriptional ArsR family regulator
MERYDPYLKGTTYKVYLHLVKMGKPEGISEVQKSLGLSSPSVAQYHVGKLLKMGLVREEQRGYVVDRLVLENIIRIRRRAIPLQTAYVAFFGVTLVLLILLRPSVVTSVYFLALAINFVALAIAFSDSIKVLKRL